MKNILLFLAAVWCSFACTAQDITTSGGTVTNGSSSVVCVAGGFTNTSYLNTASRADFAHFSLAIGVGCSYWIHSTLSASAPANAYAGFHIRGTALASLMAGIKVQTYASGAVQETVSGASLSYTGNSTEGDVYFAATKAFNEVRISFTGLVSVGYEIDIFYGYALNAPPNGYILPISFNGLLAERSGRDVRLSWSMLSDEAVNSVMVERSANGTDFEQLGAANFNGSSYSYSDPNPGTAYYRVKVTAASRTYFSKIIHINKFDGSLSVACTNPVRDRLNVLVNADAGQRFELALTTADGRPVASRSINTTSAATTISIERNNMRAGMYILTVTGAQGERVTRKLVVE